MLAATAAVAREEVHPLGRGFAEVDCPAGAGSSGPFLHTSPGGRVTLSWVEPVGNGHRLRFATWRGGAWSAARTVAEGTGWFVNWADVPSVIADDNGRMAAHWLEKSGEDTYAYDVRVSQSFDGGATWTGPITPHDDGTRTEHGFASLIFHTDYLHLVWLDGRKFANEDTPQEMTLRAARIDRHGNVSGAIELDGRTCDCCPTSVARVDGGFVVAYRDRSPDEIRDIYAVRYINGAWEAPMPVHNDGWRIDGCPVNGPALASAGGGVYVAWFTVDDGEGVVRSAHSSDAGKTFGGVVDVDDTDVLGRVALSGTRRSSPWVSWLSTGGDGAVIQCRMVVSGAVTSKIRRIADTSAAPSSGYPRITLLPDARLLVAWTDGGEALEVRTGILAPSVVPDELRPQ